VYWAEVNCKLNEAQFGFREGRRTTDPIFILSIAMQAYKKKRKPLYACFVDFAKAFDSIKHSLLWKKLADMGVSTKILNILQSIYRKNPPAESQQIMFSPHPSLAVNVTLANLKVQLLWFTDYLVLVADSESGLQDSMDRLDEFCNTWDLKINTEKTKVVIFNKPRSQLIPIFKIGSSTIDYSTHYK